MKSKTFNPITVKDVLPGKPSALIMAAINDLIKCERSSKYTIDMSFWHEPNGTCAVCLAGSVIAQRLKAPSAGCYGPGSFSRDIHNKLIALNAFRRGAIRCAFRYLCIESPANFPTYLDMPVYNDDPAAFKTCLRKTAKMLRAVGL